MTGLTIDLEKAEVKQIILRNSDRKSFTKEAVANNPELGVSSSKVISIHGFIDDLFKEKFIQIDRNGNIENARYLEINIISTSEKDVLLYRANDYFVYQNELSISIYLNESDYAHYLKTILSNNTKHRINITFFENSYEGEDERYKDDCDEVYLQSIENANGDKGLLIKQKTFKNWVNIQLVSWIENKKVDVHDVKQTDNESLIPMDNQSWQTLQKDFRDLKSILYAMAFLILLILILK